ncbi:MAG: translocation/assembly module TamB domain-containing protein, partial [Prevotella sp.]|nr:translocation/assembly module TamB domain-containing protein [Prevotella sp.]
LGGYSAQFDNVFMNLTSSPVTGLNGKLQIDSLVYDSIQVDTVRFNFKSDKDNMTYTAQVRNGRNNPQYVFNALFDGAINEKGTYLKARLYDWDDRLGVRLALQGSMEQNGIKLHLFGEKPVLGYKEFSVNDSNYIFLGDDRRVSADMVLQAADGMGVQIYTDDTNTEALQDLTVNLHRFNIGEALTMIPYTPNVQGILDGDFHLIQTPDQLSLSSSVAVKKMAYEGSPMGNIGTEFTYMPKSDGSHYVDGILTHEGVEVGTLSGTYRSQGKGYLDATLGLNRLPVDLINGFIPDKIIGFKGYAEGDLSIQGALNKPDVNGEVYLDSTYIFSEPYGVEMRFANDPVTITKSRLLFENFEMFSHNESPLNVKGYFDFSDIDCMRLDMTMRAENFLLVDAQETARSEAYGKAYVNFMGTMRGLVDNLQMRGKLDVLGTTDLNYNLKDSPLSTDNQLEGLVEFVDFRDTTRQVINRPPLTGFNMDLSVNIDDGAHVDCFLNADHSNYIDIVGGGDMRMRYNIADDLRLTGRYTIGSGEMKYSLPIIPLKTFEIEDGSYIEFTGDPMNPRLRLRATETIKSTVGDNSGDGRSVEFICGVVVSKTLQDMGLEFVIEAPEDMTVQNQLQSMTKEGRGKVAVTMLTTGMYLADGNTNSFTMNSALSAFLNSQINQISGKALRSMDVSFGVDNSFDQNGMHTDYSFKFAKRFWNNRLRIVIGGKLSSGANVTPQEQTFFDNVTFEYRLSPTSNKYLNLYYQRDSYDWLEGNVSKFGGGFLWKRKLASLKDLFRFNRDNDALPDLPADSISKESIAK